MTAAIFLYLNGTPISVSGADAFETVANFVRTRAGATGTKLVCEEGDCGACSVLVGRPRGDGLEYQPINACIQFLYQVAGTHVVTVEGLRRGKDLHPVQEAMVRCHGAQCGFCTPGFVVAMCALFEPNGARGRGLDERTVRDGLTGNLCRCTGYEPILKAALSVDRSAVSPLSELYPPAGMARRLLEHLEEPTLIEAGGRKFFAPTSVGEAVRFKAANPGAIIVQGATDIGVLRNKRGYDPPVVMNLSRIAELGELTIEDQSLRVGATVTLSRIEKAVRDRVPELYGIFLLFGAPQIKNTATLAGNIANASPIADTIPFLYVMDAQVELTGVSGTRLVNIDSFYLGYKKLDLRPDEIITRILVPLPSEGILKLYKISKRKNLDISTLTAAIRVDLTRGVMRGARIALGGVAPTVIRLHKTAQFLEGKELTKENLRAAGALARGEISPISDVRGSADFRRQLTENIFSKFYFDTRAAQASRLPAGGQERKAG